MPYDFQLIGWKVMSVRSRHAEAWMNHHIHVLTVHSRPLLLVTGFFKRPFYFSNQNRLLFPTDLFQYGANWGWMRMIRGAGDEFHRRRLVWVLCGWMGNVAACVCFYILCGFQVADGDPQVGWKRRLLLGWCGGGREGGGCLSVLSWAWPVWCGQGCS